MDELTGFIRSRQPVNLAIVTINIIVFIVLSILGNTNDAAFMLNHGTAYTPYIIENGEYYRLVSSMFLHFGLLHLLYNMLILIFLGDTLEKTVGKVRYLCIYLIGGIAGNLLSVAYDKMSGHMVSSAGASGAIFAVIGALIWIILRNQGRLETYSIRRILMMTALMVAEGFTTTGVDNCAHIGGLVGGFILAVILYRKKKALF